MSAATIIEFGILVVFFFYLRKWFLQGLRVTYKGPDTTTFWNRPRRFFPFGLLAVSVSLLLVFAASIVGEGTHHPNITNVALILLVALVVVVPGAFLVLGLESLLSNARKPYREWPMTNIEKTLELYKHKPEMKEGSALARATLPWILRQGKPSFGPAVGILEVLAERRHARNPRMLALVSSLVRLFLPASDRGWNDYHLSRWQLTGDRKELVEIHQRCQHMYDKGVGWSAVWQTAQWMTNSYREQNSSFDLAMQAVERECGCLTPGTARGEESP